MGREAWEQSGTSRYRNKTSEPGVRGLRPENSTRGEMRGRITLAAWDGGRQNQPSQSCLCPWPGPGPGPAPAPHRLSPGAQSPAPGELPALPQQRAVDAHAHACTPALHTRGHPPPSAQDTEGHSGRDPSWVLPMLPAC